MPNYPMNCTTKSAIYVMELTVRGGVSMGKGKNQSAFLK